MDKAYPSKTPMIVPSLDMNKDQFRPKGENEDLLGSEDPYLSAVGALMYIANCIRLDIVFAVNLLARYSTAPTRRHWARIKNIFRYLNGTKDLGLFYRHNQNNIIIRYTNVGYLSYPQMLDHRHGLYFYIVEQLYHGSHQNRL